MDTHEISKSGLARALGIAPARVTQLLREGLPPALANGLLDRRASLEWIEQYTSSVGGGWTTKGRDLPARARELLQGGQAFVHPQSPTRREPGAEIRKLLAQIITQSAALPELAVALGIRDMTAIAAVTDIFEFLLFHFAGDRGNRGNPNGDIRRPPKPDYAAIARRLGLSYDPGEVEAAIDVLFDRLYAFVDVGAPPDVVDLILEAPIN